MTEQSIRDAAVKQARRWIGTPFYPQQARIGVGCDCVSMAMEIYKAAGLLPDGLSLPTYSVAQDGGLVQQWLSTSPYFAPEDGWPKPGSLVTIRIGKMPHHVGIMEDDHHIINALRRYGVIRSSLRDSTFSSRLAGSWKPVCLEARNM